MRPAAALSETARMSVSVDLGTDDRGAGVGLDLAELLATRLLVQGNSGSGKSHLLRRLLEGSAGTVQQVVIDPEGDFVTLSDAFGHMVIDAASYSLGEVSTIAARIRERFERPAFAIALHPDGTGTGSGRSMPGVDLGRAVIAAVEADIIQRGGGHAMAAGVTLRPGQLGPFRAHMSEALKDSVGVARSLTALKIDAALSARGATVEFVEDVERAGPFGSGNPQPVFAFPAHKAKFAQVVGAGGHVSFQLTSDDGARLKAIAFRAATTPLGQALLGAGNDTRLHIAGTLGIDHYQGQASVQLKVTDAAEIAA